MGVRFESFTEAYRVKKWRGMSHGQKKHFQSRSMASRCVGIDYTFSLQGTFSLLTGIYSLKGLGLTGSSKPWRDCAVQGSWLDVVTSGVQVAHLGQRKNTSILRLDSHMTSCLRCPWMNLDVSSLLEIWTNNFGIDFVLARLFMKRQLSCGAWWPVDVTSGGPGKSSSVLHLFVPCKHQLNLSLSKIRAIQSTWQF